MNDVAVREGHEITPYMDSFSVAQVKYQVQQVQLLMNDLMHEGEHYGQSFPGDTKKNLLKPGADKLMFMFRLRPDFEQEIKELPGGHREVVTRCKIYHIDSGNKIAEGVGSASTMESKYRYRNQKRKCPLCGQETIKISQFANGGFYCYDKLGGCGAKFKQNDTLITEQSLGRIENPDIADSYNTVLKMSKKRAYVDATITATAASDIFTQDLEDMNIEGTATAKTEKEQPSGATEKQSQHENSAAEKESAVAENIEGHPIHEDIEQGIFSEPKTNGKDNGKPRMLSPGEKIPSWFWNIKYDEKANYIPAGCRYSKVNGEWLCIQV